ncbi:MAG: ATP synthase F1 subunit epsilon [Verrucomicrobia bacterium]|nr:ATP synthase F1 subunit epsilon [Verrucomicrobiota bacterium]
MPTLRLEIVTPDAKTFSEDVDMVTMPGADGELGILPLHAPLMTQLKPGELRISKGGKETVLAVGDGFAEVLPHRVSILTDLAVTEHDIDEAAVQSALERAQAAKANKDLGSEEQATVEAAIAKSLAQLHVKRRRRSA